VCTESLSIDLYRPTLDASARSLDQLSEKISRLKDANSEKLQSEYSRLVDGLRDVQAARETDDLMANPGLIRGNF
jgi:DNA excision repair protein ERCC-2